MESVHISLEPECDAVRLSTSLQFVSPGEQVLFKLIRAAPVARIGGNKVGLLCPYKQLGLIEHGACFNYYQERIMMWIVCSWNYKWSSPSG